MKRILAVLAALAFAAAASAQTYKWVDKDGKVRYGDTPPPGASVSRLKPPPPGVASPAPAPASEAKTDGAKPLSPEAAFQKRQKEQQDQEEKVAKERAETDTKRMN